jgi:transcriptional regulator with XRE-family HTH domain
MTVGDELRALRVRSGRTQADVAAAAGIPAPVLSAYERNRRQPGADTAAHIAGVLGYRLTFSRLPDPVLQARRLVEVLTLAEALPYRPRPLGRARW